MIALLATLLALQDRIDLNPPIDTWYKVIQGSRQVGYFHETWRRSPSRWRYEYGYEGEFELTIRGKPHAEDLSAAAFLDESFTPLEYSSDGHVQDASISLLMFTHGDQRRVELGTTSWSLPARDDVFVLPTLTLYALRQNETLSKPGRVTLRAGLALPGLLEVVLEVGELVRVPAALPGRLLQLADAGLELLDLGVLLLQDGELAAARLGLLDLGLEARDLLLLLLELGFLLLQRVLVDALGFGEVLPEAGDVGLGFLGFLRVLLGLGPLGRRVALQRRDLGLKLLDARIGTRGLRGRRRGAARHLERAAAGRALGRSRRRALADPVHLRALGAFEEHEDPSGRSF